MIQAFLYLQITSFRNLLVQRARRLKQGKYLAGAVVGGAYFYYFFFRPMFTGSRNPLAANSTTVLPPEYLPMLVSMGAVVLLLIAAGSWIIPNRRAALHFTETEVAFLFPAPVSRQRLIHFKLLRSQLGILVTVFFVTIIFRRASVLGGTPFIHAVGWWVALSTINLHLIGASFARDQLLDLGVNPARRRLAGLGLLALVGVGCWWWLRETITAPTAHDLASLPEFTRYIGNILAQPVLQVLLTPFTWVIRPYFATGLRELMAALGPAVLVIAAHYWWVIRANVSFEEATLDQARQQAEKTAAFRSGDWRGMQKQTAKARPTPFHLAATGPLVVAFLWKNLLALGPHFRPRNWFALAGLIVAFHLWAANTHLRPEFYQTITIISVVAGSWLLIIGPMLMRSDLRLLISHFDLLKSYPLRGWQVVLGSLLPSLVVLAAIEWLLLLLAAPSLLSNPSQREFAEAAIITGALGIAIVLPPLSGLMLSIPYAATLFFPAWSENRSTRGGGIEAMGQRLIFFVCYIVVLLIALLPAVLCGGLAAFIAHWLGGMVAAILAATFVASIIIGVEFAAVVWWLGDRFEHFDLSEDLPR